MPYVIGQQPCAPKVENINDILTEDWIALSNGIVIIVDSMGSNFSRTKDDMAGNVVKITAKYEQDKEAFKTVFAMLQDEKDKKEDGKDKSATVGGLWLKRGLEYLTEVFYEVIAEHDRSKLPGNTSDSGSIKKACNAAYDITLKKYHNIVVKGLVKVALTQSPYKETFMTTLAGKVEGKTEEVVEEMKRFEPCLRDFVHMLGKLFNNFCKEDKKDTLLATASEKMEQQQKA